MISCRGGVFSVQKTPHLQFFAHDAIGLRRAVEESKANYIYKLPINRTSGRYVNPPHSSRLRPGFWIIIPTSPFSKYTLLISA